jgi:putative PIN family toxin of toxin-antitoxin system
VRVVVDTNVVVSAALKDRDPEAVLVHVVERPEIEWVATQEIIDEYLEVLARPRLALSEDVLSRWRESLARNVVLVEPAPPVSFARDRKDEKFLACALAAAADYFITGDLDFAEASQLIATRIVSVSQFKRLFLPEPDAD